MWGTVLLMAVVVAVDPGQVGAVAYILSRERALRLLVAYSVGGFGVSLMAGGVILFVLGQAGLGKYSSLPPEIEIAVGALALVVAALVGTGLAGRLRQRARLRRATSEPPGQAGTRWPRTAERGTPGFDKLPHRLQDALHNESPWIVWAYGVAVGMPSAYYLAALAAILKSGAGTSAQIGALLVFNFVAFAIAEIPLVSFALAPEATRRMPRPVLHLDQHSPADRGDDPRGHRRGLPDRRGDQQALTASARDISGPLTASTGLGDRTAHPAPNREARCRRPVPAPGVNGSARNLYPERAAHNQRATPASLSQESTAGMLGNDRTSAATRYKI